MLLAGATSKLVKFNDETILRKCDTSTNIDRINHTDIELVAVVWLNVEVVTIFLKAIADAWVEDSNILLGSIAAPEWILRAQAASTRSTRARSANGHPWAAHQDDNFAVDAENLLHAWSQFKARKFPSLEGVNALGSKVEVVDSFDAVN